MVKVVEPSVPVSGQDTLASTGRITGEREGDGGVNGKA